MYALFTKPEILNALDYAEAAHYKSADELKAIYGDAVTVIDPLLKGKGDACVIINHGDLVVIAFPGSNDWIDWVLNLYRANRPKNNKVLAGMQYGLDLMGDMIMEVLQNLKPDRYLITGVSRGGGLSDLFLEFWGPRLGNVQIDCITFAQPRVLTRDWYKSINIPMKDRPNVNYLRVHMANDIVTKLPREKYGYTFYGQDLELGRKYSWREQFYMTYRAYREHGRIGLRGIEEHSVEVLREALQQLS